MRVSPGNQARVELYKFAFPGAAALYLLDFDGTNLPNLKDAIKKSYPDVYVRTSSTCDGYIELTCECDPLLHRWKQFRGMQRMTIQSLGW